MATWDGLDEAALARRTRAPRAIIRASVPSVMDIAHELGEQGAPSGTIVIADEQTAGRGRAGRQWFSPPGAGLWLAMLLRPSSPPSGGALAIRVGLAVRDALSQAADLAAGLKWPNDIVVAGQKLGGVLCEARWTGAQLGWIAAGVGLNVHGPLAPEVRASATAIRELVPGVSRIAVLEELAPRVAAVAAAPGPLQADERAAYLACLWMPPGTEAVLGIEPDGALLVRTAEGRVVRRTEAD